MTEHAKMYIETLEAITYCEDCHGQYRTIDYGKTCPYCHSENTYLLRGNEFLILRRLVFMKILELKQNIFKENEVTADKIREEF